MPPNLDIYILSLNRDEDTINRFIDDYVDRSQSDDRGDEELMIRKVDAADNSDSVDDYEWEPAVSLSHAIHRGLEHPYRSFSIYLKPKHMAFDSVTLGFTSDGKMVWGLSIDDADELPETLETAKRLLISIFHQFNGIIGVILVEEPPPRSEDKFRQAMSLPVSLYVYPECGS